MFHAVTAAATVPVFRIIKVHPEQFPLHHPDTLLIHGRRRRRRRLAVQRPDDGVQLIQAQVRNKDQKVRQKVSAAAAALRNVLERIAEQRASGGKDKAVHAARPISAAHERVRKCRARVQIRQLFDKDGPTDVDDAAAFLRVVAVVVGRADAVVAAVPGAGGEVGWVFFASGRFQSGRFIVPAEEQS
jgi:hypothetical protein